MSDSVNDSGASDPNVTDPMSRGTERNPNSLNVNIRIPWELLSDIQKVQLRYGGGPEKIELAIVRRILLDALCRELRALGYYGSGADMWYGSPMHRIR